MTPRPGTPTDPAQPPPTRAERQEQTRAALVGAARGVFARDGFHGARLDVIAREAGFSKGAVYSNFESKADLFLAVMEANFAAASAQGWDPFRTPVDASCGDPEDPESAEYQEARGFALTTLEFIAAAGRDQALTARLAAHAQGLIDYYTDAARSVRPEDEPLAPAQVGALLSALDQGSALLNLGGITTIDDELMRAGLDRLAGRRVPRVPQDEAPATATSAPSTPGSSS